MRRPRERRAWSVAGWRQRLHLSHFLSFFCGLATALGWFWSTSASDCAHRLEKSADDTSSGSRFHALAKPTLSWADVSTTASDWATDPSTPTLLAISADFIRRHSGMLDGATSGGPTSGVFVRSGAALRRNLQRARGGHSSDGTGPDCRRQVVLPVQCLQTRGEAAFLQESLAWHLLAGWAHAVVFVDLGEGDGRWPHTLAALRPFVEAGAATAVRVVHRRSDALGSGELRDEALQGALGRLCVEAVHAGGCGLTHAPDAGQGDASDVLAATRSLAPGTPHRLPASWGPSDLPTTDDRSLGWPPCPPSADRAWEERVWVSKLDDDEFVAPRGPSAGACVSDLLRRPDILAAGGVCPPWLVYGGHAHVEHPREEEEEEGGGGGLALVTEVFTGRAPSVRAVGKVIARLPGLASFEDGGLWPYYDAAVSSSSSSSGGSRPRPISGLGSPCIFPPASVPAHLTNASWPPLVTGHFYGRAMDRGLLKWARGRPGFDAGAAGRWPRLRRPSELVTAQWDLPAPGRPLGETQLPPDKAFSVDEPLSPQLSAQVRVALGLPPRPRAVT